MRIIPVLDLKGGQVVRAAGGRRDTYRPITTPLCEGSDIRAVARGLRNLHPFPTFYVADLDAIEGDDPNTAQVTSLRDLDNPPDIWLDAGFRDAAALDQVLALPGVCPVLGSESQRDSSLLQRFREHPRLVLSLDFFADGFRGPPSLLAETDIWPSRVIVMTLAKVGSGSGPDLARLEEIAAKAGSREIIAAGGVRNEADIRALSSLGITAALVATSLHDGTLAREFLAELAWNDGAPRQG
ncbi:HisA/HisF-related TIM barrel protein [Arvimicrobium flavum]|uniref:HisA/HisF-related TIM barrel protein n=1 Tax=Arvimicrobium flavum TaxID=3393320 RepID=UPI00237B44ED|nr:HisA/HisF-related TIM barrel protein [Mesorhizobium shangrilense]